MAKLNKETDIYQNITQVLCGMIWPSGAGLLAFVFSGSFTLDLLVSFLLSISLTRKVRGKINQSNQKQCKQKRVILLFQIEKFHAYLAICLGDKWVLPGFLSLPLGLLFLQVCPHPYHQSSEKWLSSLRRLQLQWHQHLNPQWQEPALEIQPRKLAKLAGESPVLQSSTASRPAQKHIGQLLYYPL